jgi:hypothetical protein
VGEVNLTDLWHDACEGMLYATRKEVHMNGVTSFMFDKVFRADSMDYEFDLGTELWLTKSRFTSLKRDYLDPFRIEKFIKQSGELPDRRVAIAQMMCRIKPERHHGKDWTSYKWGNCILGFTFRAVPTPHFTMHARTTLITRMGGMDLALAYCIARDIAEERDEDLSDYKFTWYIASLYHSSLHAIPYFYAHKLDETMYDWDRETYPVVGAMQRQIEYNDRLDEEGRVIKHGTRERLRKQRRAYKAGELPIAAPVSMDDLDLDNLESKR